MNLSRRFKRMYQLWVRSGLHHVRFASMRPPFVISTRGRKTMVAAPESSGSATCYREIVVEDCYRLFALPNGLGLHAIVDVGANIGMFSKLASVLFPEARIESYEPNPSAFAWLERNRAETNIECYCRAVTAKGAPIRFNVGLDSTLGRADSAGGIVVDAVAVSELNGGKWIDLLKLDCEGGEWDILRDGALLRRTGHLCMEFHVDAAHSVPLLQDWLKRAGHRVTSITQFPGAPTGHLSSVRVGR